MCLVDDQRPTLLFNLAFFMSQWFYCARISIERRPPPLNVGYILKWCSGLSLSISIFESIHSLKLFLATWFFEVNLATLICVIISTDLTHTNTRAKMASSSVVNTYSAPGLVSLPPLFVISCDAITVMQITTSFVHCCKVLGSHHQWSNQMLHPSRHVN